MERTWLFYRRGEDSLAHGFLTMETITRCMRCNRLLTGKKAKERGMGRLCYQKFQAELARDKELNTSLFDFLE